MSELCVSHLSCVTVVYLCRCRVRYLHSARASTRIISYVMYIIIKMYTVICMPYLERGIRQDQERALAFTVYCILCYRATYAPRSAI